MKRYNLRSISASASTHPLLSLKLKRTSEILVKPYVWYDEKDLLPPEDHETDILVYQTHWDSYRTTSSFIEREHILYMRGQYGNNSEVMKAQHIYWMKIGKPDAFNIPAP